MGIPRKNVNKLQEGFRFGRAVIQIIDWTEKTVVFEKDYKSPKEHLKPGLSMMFKGVTFYDDKYYVVTNTEVLVYDYNTFDLLDVFSHPTFNDLHGIYVDEEALYVCNTGLEVVQIFRNKKLVDEVNLARNPTWERFDKGKDYRMLGTTKPHESHINQIFLLNGELWVTRFQKRDVVPLYNRNSERRIVLPHDAGCHDGIVVNGFVYFSMVNGHVIVLDSKNLKVVEDYDLNYIYSKNVGWTRGLAIVDNFAFIGVTAIRYSKFKEFARGIAKGKDSQKMPSTILKLDLNKHKIIDEYQLKNPGAATYTIMKYTRG